MLHLFHVHSRVSQRFKRCETSYYCPEILVRRVYSWLIQGKVTYAQWDLFRRRVDIAPRIFNARLEGKTLVITLEKGRIKRILPNGSYHTKVKQET